jgi:tetratricopeptide (TPR) repeat protein
VLAARIDRLEPEDKHLLQSAAVIGKDVPYAILRAIADRPEDALRQGLARLQGAEFLYETSLFPDLEYTFKHALTHEVAYASLLGERRRAVHGRIVDAIEGEYPGRLAEHAERLAQHAVRGERWDTAVHYLREAMAKAEARLAYREAIDYSRQALAALDHLPETRAALETALTIRLGLRNSHWALAQYEPILEQLQTAEALAERLNDPRQLAQVCLYMSSYCWTKGDHGRALQAGPRALAIATSLHDFAVETAANVYLGYVYAALGDYPRAIEVLAPNVAALQGDLTRERFGLATLAAVTSRGWMALSLAQLGRFGEAIALVEEGTRLAAAAEHRYSCVAASIQAGLVYLQQGDLDRTIAVLQSNLALGREGRILNLLPGLTLRLAIAHALAGRLAEAAPLLVEAAAQVSAAGAHQAIFTTELGKGYFLTGREDAAADHAARGLALARDRQERGTEAMALHLLGEIAAHANPPAVEQAEAHYRQALTLADELGMRPLVAHCHLGLGTLYRRAACPDQARAALTRCADLYRALDMPFYLARADRMRTSDDA